jgi:hypothetical protein
MTRQAANTIVYEGESYELLGDSSGQLPMVKRYGMQPQSWSTANHAGYIAEYAIVDQKLLLTSLMINDAADYYPEIGGIQPIDKYPYGAPVYEPLSELMTITGAITVGKGKPENWLSADIRSVHDYVVALKVTLEDGVVQSVEDISEPAAAIRKRMQQIYEARTWQPGIQYVETESEREELNRLFDESWALRYSTKDNEG